MINDPNSYKANSDVLKSTISQLEKDNNILSNELHKVLNSRGVRIISKARRILPSKSKVKTAKTQEKEVVPAQDIHTTYNSHYEDNINYFKLGYQPEVKALAFYLPQFHTFKENDQWWGKGFTEWTNTKKSVPRYDGHYQPREPHDDIGYYTLDNAETIRKQVTLAKQHGIYGFCFYYYWFSGKRLMEKPVDILLKNKDINFPFCLCWANENWTRTWDGLNKNILIEQKYQANDPENFILSLKKYIEDPRYIKVDGKPVILIYAPDSIPDYETTVYRWRETARNCGIGEILIWSKNNIFDHEFKNSSFVDAEFDFAPTGCSFSDAIIEQSSEREVFNYEKAVDNCYKNKLYYSHYPVKPFYYSCTMGWDNSARRQKGYCVLSEYSPQKFYEWLRLIIEETKRRFSPDQRFIFINAWNEWAEGVYLEPDKKYGYTNINTAAKAIYGLPYNEEDVFIIDKHTPKCKNPGKIAVQAHVYYVSVLDDLLKNLAQIPYNFDLFISTDTINKKILIEETLPRFKLKTNRVTVEVIDNIGRDVYPFLQQLSKKYKSYDIIGHFHGKKTTKEFFGDDWRQSIYHDLLGSSSNISKLFSLFDNQNAGLIAPQYFYLHRDSINIGSNLENINLLLDRMGFNTVSKDKIITFPAGTMFWAKTKCIDEIFKIGLEKEDFPIEEGQVDGTIAHAIERLLGILPEEKGYKTIIVSNKGD